MWAQYSQNDRAQYDILTLKHECSALRLSRQNVCHTSEIVRAVSSTSRQVEVGPTVDPVVAAAIAAGVVDIVDDPAEAY